MHFALAQGHIAKKWYLLARSCFYSPTLSTTVFLLTCAEKQFCLKKKIVLSVLLMTLIMCKLFKKWKCIGNSLVVQWLGL